MGDFLRRFGFLIYWACIALFLTGAMHDRYSNLGVACIAALILLTLPVGLLAIPGSFHGGEDALIGAVIVSALINSFVYGLIWLSIKVKRSPNDQ